MPLLPPPILSVTVIAYKSSAFVWIDLATSISSLKKDTQGSCRIFHFAVCRSSFGPTLYGCTISVYHLKKSFFSFHSSAPKRGNLYSWPPTTCAGSKCQNVVKNCSLEVQAAETHATLFRTRSTATPRHGSFATTSIYKVIISFRSFFILRLVLQSHYFSFSVINNSLKTVGHCLHIHCLFEKKIHFSQNAYISNFSSFPFLRL